MMMEGSIGGASEGLADGDAEGLVEGDADSDVDGEDDGLPLVLQLGLDEGERDGLDDGDSASSPIEINSVKVGFDIKKSSRRTFRQARIPSKDRHP
jgi:hypothetical protein